MHKIQKLSTKFSFLFKAMMWLLPFLAALYWINSPSLIKFGLQVSNTPAELMHDGTTARVLAFIVTMLPVGNLVIGLYWLRRLFTNFSRGKVFSIDNVSFYRNLGLSLFCLSITDNLFDTLITIVMTYHQSSGPVYAFGFDTAQITYVVLGSVIWLTSYVIKEAYYLESEAQLTI